MSKNTKSGHFSVIGRKKGISTLEVVIIIAVLLSVALIFREALTSYASRLIDSVFGEQSIIADLIDNGEQDE